MGLQACTHPPNGKRKERAMREKVREGSPFKNAENDYFDQRFECAAPKRLSKYITTPSCETTQQLISIAFGHSKLPDTFQIFNILLWTLGARFGNDLFVYKH